ncbi:MAG: hypothetical protein M1360_04595 [Candidatus Marsarchaeota archaeon]|jgi:hypothetical protein|nr:hypothetical protein [Candidatus Marsarchaeota archaeon]MCL5419185.1 hypothetical protein [Candidatus Marsarchaeota archaeon]
MAENTSFEEHVRPFSDKEINSLSDILVSFIRSNFDIKIKPFNVEILDGLHNAGRDVLSKPEDNMIYIDANDILEKARHAKQVMNSDLSLDTIYDALTLKIMSDAVMHMIPGYKSDDFNANFVGTAIAYCVTQKGYVKFALLRLSKLPILDEYIDMQKYYLGGFKAVKLISDMKGDTEEILIEVRKEIIPVTLRTDNRNDSTKSDKR